MTRGSNDQVEVPTELLVHYIILEAPTDQLEAPIYQVEDSIDEAEAPYDKVDALRTR